MTLRCFGTLEAKTSFSKEKTFTQKGPGACSMVWISIFEAFVEVARAAISSPKMPIEKVQLCHAVQKKWTFLVSLF